MPLFSIVIPLYNKEKHIAHAIESVLNQTIQNFEIIVINDGSSDLSADIVKKYADERIRLINQENHGVSYARNTGIKEAKSDLIAFLDADDEYKPFFLESILRLSITFPNAGLYATKFQVMKRYGKLVDPDFKFLPLTYDGLIHNYFRSSIFGHFIISSSAVCIPKKIFIDIGMFNENSSYGEDSDLYGRIAIKYSIAYSNEVASIWYQNAENRSTKNRNVRIVKEHCFINSAMEAIKNGMVKPEMLNDLMEYIAYLQLVTASNNIIYGNNKQALSILKECKTNLLYRKKLKLLTLALIPSFLFTGLYQIVEFSYLRVKQI
jgi:glycosyltransferase involved in cell wall biosynthesis